MDERTRRPHLPLKAALLAAIVMIAAATGLSLASTDPDQDEVAASSSVANGRQLALGKARAAALSRRVHGAIGRARATGRGHRAGKGLGAPPASAPGLVAGVPAPAATPGSPASVTPEPPVVPESPAAPSPPAAPPPTEGAPPAPPANPAPPVTTPPTPTPSPQPKPTPNPPPKTSTPDIDPGVPVEPPAPAPKASLVLGIDGGYAGWIPAEVQQRVALGAPVTRHEWSLSNPVSSEEDQVLAAATEIHTRILALLGGNDLGDAAHYSDWVIGFIRHYGPGGTFWAEHPELDASRYAIDTIELGNEPYFGEMSPEDYADTVRPTLERISELGLPVKVVLPSRVYGTDTSWIDTLYARIPNLNTLFYAFADHPYWYGHDPAEVSAAGPFGRIDVLRDRMNEKGASAKPIFITEYGESTAGCGGECVSEAVQAEHLRAMIEAVVTHTEWKVGLLSLFQLIDRGTGSGDRELQFGLLREDGTPKPAYEIVRAAMQLYR
jgi:outer membrane biosynthesis protein TonB